MREISFSGVLPKQPNDGLKEFRIGISGFYGMGPCFYSPILNKAFQNLTTRLRNHLDDVFSAKVKYEDREDSGYCDLIKGISGHEYVHLHPMEFTGYLTSEDIESLREFTSDYIAELLDEFPDIVNYSKVPFEVTISFERDTCSMSDEEYKQLILDHKDDILKVVQEYYNKLSQNEKNHFRNWGHSYCGERFASTARINRDSDKPGLSSFDVDWSTVADIVKEAIKSGQIK